MILFILFFLVGFVLRKLFSWKTINKILLVSGLLFSFLSLLAMFGLSNDKSFQFILGALVGSVILGLLPCLLMFFGSLFADFFNKRKL